MEVINMIGELLEVMDIPRKDLSNLLPLILLEIRNYTNQYFLTTTHSKIVKVESKKVYVEDVSKFGVNDTVEIVNKGIFTIDTIGADYFTVDQYLEQVEDNSVAIKLNFRGVNIFTLMTMMNYMNSDMSERVVISQSQGGRSVTYADATNQSTLFPINLYGSLQSLRKLNDDGLEYIRKGYEQYVLH